MTAPAHCIRVGKWIRTSLPRCPKALHWESKWMKPRSRNFLCQNSNGRAEKIRTARWRIIKASDPAPISRCNTNSFFEVMRKSFLCLVFTSLGLATATATPTENTNFRVLPAPAKMVVDGKSDDWDLSGG